MPSDAELREMLARATPGPWQNYRMFGDHQNEVCQAGNYATGGVAQFDRRDDADLAVAAVNSLPALLTRIEVLEKALLPFAQALDECGDDARHSNVRSLWEHPLSMNISVGDFRDARAAFPAARTAIEGGKP